MGALLALSRGIDRITTLIGRSVSWLILLAVRLLNWPTDLVVLSVDETGELQGRFS